MGKDINAWVKKYKDDFGFMPTRLAMPTKAAPGSPRRVEIMAERVEQGKPIFVQGDTSLIPMRRSGLDNLDGTTIKGDENCGAQYSNCGTYQYRLWRRWDKSKPIPSVIGLHPGKYSHEGMDSLVRSILVFCQRFGCGGFDYLNLFGMRGEDWGSIMRSEVPTGDHNDRAIRYSTESTSFTICAWGLCGWHQFRSARVLWGLRKRVEAKKLLCFGLTDPELSPINSAGGRMVCQPVPLDSVNPRHSVTVQLPFSMVDYNDVDDTEEEE